ncbi:MAG: monovalent cation/H+ antiporter subunit D, partial [Gemmatimonadaceae bacterium]
MSDSAPVLGHLLAVPIALPIAAGMILLLLGRRSIALQRAVGLTATAIGLAVAVGLATTAAGGDYTVYRLGDWPAPAAIVLVLDRLSALMVLLTAIVAVGSLAYACLGTDRKGAHFHALFQLQLAGLNGAFLTGDLFNLFVFFEVLLIASYCLLLHGGGAARLRAGLHYVTLNLAGSALFLIAVGLLYAVTGALNMADLSVRVAQVAPADAALVRAAGLLLFVVFALKAAVLPLYFWLPKSYAAATGPVAALFALMTKVGVYALLRVSTLVFGPLAGPAADLALPWLLPVALATQAAGVLGALAARDLRRLQAYLLVTSVGLMLGGIGLYSEQGVAAALYYLAHSTLITAALFLLVDLIARQRGATGPRLRSAVAVSQPALLGGLFFVGSMAVVGLPPLSGFLGKALVLAATPLDGRGIWLWAVTLTAGLLSLVACSRAGSIVFWNSTAAVADTTNTIDSSHSPHSPHSPHSASGERTPNGTNWRALPVVALLGTVVLLSVL